MNEIDFTTIAVVLIGIVAWWIFRDKDFSEKDLVSFGNYLLSKERFDRIKEAREDAFEERFGKVSDADLDFWRGER